MKLYNNEKFTAYAKKSMWKLFIEVIYSNSSKFEEKTSKTQCKMLSNFDKFCAKLEESARSISKHKV